MLSRAVLLVFPCILSIFSVLGADCDRRPIRSVYTLEIGGSHDYCSYLSPLGYNGWSLALGGEWSKKMPFNPQSYSMQFEADIEANRGANMRKNAHMWHFKTDFAWGVTRRFALSPKFTLEAGAMAGADAGALYAPRNGNNPVSVQASLGIDLQARAAYRFNIGRLQLTAADRMRIPSVSLFFSQQYGESYYELGLGDFSGTAHCGWWGNRFGLDNLLSAEMHLGGRNLLLGWRFSLQSSWICSINTQIWRNAFVVGITY